MCRPSRVSLADVWPTNVDPGTEQAGEGDCHARLAPVQAPVERVDDVGDRTKWSRSTFPAASHTPPRPPDRRTRCDRTRVSRNLTQVPGRARARSNDRGPEAAVAKPTDAADTLVILPSEKKPGCRQTAGRAWRSNKAAGRTQRKPLPERNVPAHPVRTQLQTTGIPFFPQLAATCRTEPQSGASRRRLATAFARNDRPANPNIWRYSFQTWGADQADRYLEQPEAGNLAVRQPAAPQPCGFSATRK